MAKAVATAAKPPSVPKAVALANMFEADSGSGFENADAAAYAIPFLQILQALSPQCKRSDGAYIKGAEEGMFFNTVTQELFDGSEDKGVHVVPCYFKRSFIRWAPRDKGGGFRGEFSPSDPIVSKTKRSEESGRDELDNGDWLVDTRVHYVLLLKPDDTFAPAVISLSSTQLKKSRTWMSKMEGIKFLRTDENGVVIVPHQPYTPPMFSHIYHLTTIPESNEKGSWYGLKVVLEGPVDDPALFTAAKEFKRQISAGEVREQVPSAPHDPNDPPF